MNDCEGKAVHFNLRDAQEKAERISADKFLRMKVEAYQCSVCRYWHCRRVS